MSTFSGYKTKAFSESQKFFVLDPNTGTPSFVQGSDLVAQLTPNSTYVFSESTRTTAQTTDYELGAVIQTGGATATGDGQAGVYLVVAAGEGDFPMDNGLELLTLAGDDTLLERLALNTVGDGSDLVAHTGTANTVTEAIDQNIADINQRTIYVGSVAELEALSLDAGVNVYLTQEGRAGEFVVKTGTPPTDTYKGFYIVLANGNYAERADKTVATPEMFGAKADWNGTVGTDIHDIIQAMLDMPDVNVLRGTGNPYYFGNVAQNATQILVTRDVDIDWGGSLLVCEGDNTVSGADANLFTFQDCRMNMRNYEFIDTQFTLSGPSRGVAPAILKSNAASIQGHQITGFHIQKGQSVLTCISSDPSLYRASDIFISGSADKVYYGFNGANNGDSVRGGYSVNQCNRLVFVYGCNDVDLNARCDTGDPSSANILVSAVGTGFPDTENIRIKATFGTLDGPIVISDQPAANGSGVYRNINLSVEFDALGANLPSSSPIVRMGAYDGGGSIYTTEKTISADEIKVELIKSASVPLLDIPLQVYTPSPNYGVLEIAGNCGYVKKSVSPKNASGVTQSYTLRRGDKYSNRIFGDLTAASSICVIPAKYLSSAQKNGQVSCLLSVEATNNTGGQLTYAQYSVIGGLSSTGAFTLTDATQISQRSTGGVTPIITVATAAANAGLAVSMDSYTNANAILTASVSWS